LLLAIFLAVAWTACGSDDSGSKKSSTSERDDDRDDRDNDDDTSADDPEIDYNDDEEPDPSGFPGNGTCDDWDDWECTDEGEGLDGMSSGGCHATCRDDDGVLHRFTMPAYEDIIPACWHGDDLDTCRYEHWTDDPCSASGTCGRAFRDGCCNYGVD
jgi:hypothetical protein